MFNVQCSMSNGGKRDDYSQDMHTSTSSVQAQYKQKTNPKSEIEVVLLSTYPQTYY
ncbi:MAG: hypothetical protein G01um101416_1107 [Microgenomates group bacterium Gr01-1014_16]|nr:MAG: hypothetical protein G01um101416_1107 [Microgenomates group bacterium Gr01-1014_16]